MEQYWMPKELDFVHLRRCIDKYEADRLYIRDCGGYRKDGKFSCQGMGKINEDLSDRVLDFVHDDNGLYMLVYGKKAYDSKKVHLAMHDNGVYTIHDDAGKINDEMVVVRAAAGRESDDVNSVLEDNGLHLLPKNVHLPMLVAACHFPLKRYSKGFSVDYERFEADGRLHYHYGIPDNPYDENLLEPRTSSLRIVLDDDLMEIYFKGRIDIEFHSWWNPPHWAYWQVKA